MAEQEIEFFNPSTDYGEEQTEQAPVIPIGAAEHLKDEELDEEEDGNEDKAEEKSDDTPFSNLKEFVVSSLVEEAEEDEELSSALKKDNKNMEECLGYIFECMYKKMLKYSSYGIAVNDYADNRDIVDMAITYYKDDSIKPKPLKNVSVAVKSTEPKKTEPKPTPNPKVGSKKWKDAKIGEVSLGGLFGDADF